MIVCSCNVLSDSQVRAVADQHGSLRTAQVHCSLGVPAKVRALLQHNSDDP